MESSKKLKTSSDFMLYKGDGESLDFFLFNVKEGQVFQINATSYDFLSLCNGERTLQEIFVEMAKMYSIEGKTLEKDFTPLIEQWSELKIFI